MRVEIIGTGTDRQGSPCEVGICFDDEDRPIFLSQGSGRDAVGGTLTLQQLRGPHMLGKLEQCRCQWLIRLAEEEDQRGQRFSGDEIFARWRQRC